MLPTLARPYRIPRRMSMTMHDDRSMRLRHERSRWPKTRSGLLCIFITIPAAALTPRRSKKGRTAGRELLPSMVHPSLSRQSQSSGEKENGPRSTRRLLPDMHLTRLDNYRRFLHVNSDQGLIPGIRRTTVRRLPVTPITEGMRSPALLHPHSSQTPNRH